MASESCIWLSPEDRAALEGWVADRNTPQKLVWRARIVLMWAEGAGVTAIVRATGKTKRTAYRWRDRYVARGIEGLKRDASRPGRKPPLSAEVIERVVHMTLHEKPPAGTHWSVRKLAKAVGLSHSSVQRIWAAHGLKPHLTKTFKLSNDPQFGEKVQDVVGLYLDPPDKALVLVRRREEPDPGARPHAAGAAAEEGPRRHDDARLQAPRHHDAVCRPRRGHRQGDRPLPAAPPPSGVPALPARRSTAPRPKRLDLHLIVDNYATHKHPKVKAWLAKHPRFHLHFTPTSASWLNLVERFFGLITEDAIRRGVFRSVADLEAAIEAYLEHHNADPKPFVWTAKAADILSCTGD